MLMCATPPAGMVPRLQMMVDGAIWPGEQAPWLGVAPTYVTPAGNSSATVTFRADLPPAVTFCSVIRRSIRVPIGIAVVGLGWTDVVRYNGLAGCAEASLVGPTTPAPTKTANRAASVAATTTTRIRLAFGP